MNFAIIGKMGSGKTLVTDIMADYFGFTKGVLSYPLKIAAAEFWGGGMKIDREKGQKLGEAIQDIDPDALVNAFLRRTEGEYGPFVVEAPRYPSDYEGLAVLGYRFIEVWAPEVTRIDRLQRAGHGRITDVDKQINHVTETALDDRSRYPVDYIVHNGADMGEEDALEQVRKLLRNEETRG